MEVRPSIATRNDGQRSPLPAFAKASAWLAFTDGNSLSEGIRLYEKALAGSPLTPEEERAASSAVGYMQGFLGGCAVWATFDKDNCPIRLPKEGVTTPQAIKIVEKFLNDHPEDLHSVADGLCYVALAKAFPI